jgi:hypothetical protein
VVKQIINKNWRKLSTNLYLANNQNGFNNCLYNYFGAVDNPKFNQYSKKQIRQSVEDYPKYVPEWHSGGVPIYPCIFVLIDNMFECNRIYIDVVKPGTFDDLVHQGYYKNL